MFEDPMQWVVIGIVVIALLMWGPSKIPQLAASLGKARKEFDTARKSFEDPMGALVHTATQQPTAQSPATQVPVEQPQPSGDEVLVKTAREMGIATEGKSREQLSAEMVSKATQKAPAAQPAQPQ